jgi:quinol monooxygenase YgiN
MSQSQQSLDQQREEVLRILNGMDPNASIAATTAFKISKEAQGDFERIVAELVRATLRMEGVTVFDYLKHLSIHEDAGSLKALQYLIYEKWGSVSSYIKQWNSDQLKKFQAAVVKLAMEPPALNFYQSGSQAAHVLRTGQKRCWNEKGDSIACAGTGEDGAIRAGVPAPYPRFTDNNDGTITDGLTGLIWLKNANLYGEVPWEQALGNARSLASGSGGLTDGSVAGDWRLPNVNEFQSLLDLNNTSGPAITPDHPFINLYPSNYWTSTSVALAPALGWFVALAVGPPVFDLKMNSMRMWPVRGGDKPRIAQTGQNQCFGVFGQPMDCAGTGQDADIRAGLPFPTPRFNDNNNGTVTDGLTELTWLKNANAFGTKSWRHALETCNSLAEGSGGLRDGSKAGDWRLPNLFELRSLMDYSAYNPALTAGHPFENVIPSLYWSSTTVASAPNLARFVFVGVGPSVWDHKSVNMHVWPVRGGVRVRDDKDAG